MHRLLVASLLTFFSCALFGCADVPEHDLHAVVEYDGQRFEGVIAYPDHDDDFSGGDDSCGFTTGNCGQRSHTNGALVSGDLPFEGATLEGDADAQTYDIFLRRSPEDQAAEDAAAKESAAPRHRFTCRVYGSQLGDRVECYGTSKGASIVLTRR